MKKLYSLLLALFFCLVLSVQAFADAWVPPSYGFMLDPAALIIALVLAVGVIAAAVIFLVIRRK